MTKNKKFKLLRNAAWKFLGMIRLGGCVQLFLESTLVDDGWFNSFYKKESVDKNNNPIPWNTYPFLKFIESRLKKDFDVFEYGCGNSTIWYSKRINSIIAVENDEEWYKKIKVSLPENAHVVYRELKYGGEYSREVLAQDKQFDIIIIDGRDRENSVRNSIKKLKKDGVIVFDNSELAQYQSAVKHLADNHYKQLAFWGMSPITAHYTSTSIFYRTENCLKI